jgi:hypothetical protein
MGFILRFNSQSRTNCFMMCETALLSVPHPACGNLLFSQKALREQNRPAGFRRLDGSAETYSSRSRMRSIIWAMNPVKKEFVWERPICFPSVYVKAFHISGHLIRKQHLKSGLLFLYITYFIEYISFYALKDFDFNPTPSA